MNDNSAGLLSLDNSYMLTGSPLLRLAQLGEHGQILQRRRILRYVLSAGCDVAKQSPHDLAAARLR